MENQQVPQRSNNDGFVNPHLFTDNQQSSYRQSSTFDNYYAHGNDAFDGAWALSNPGHTAIDQSRASALHVYQQSETPASQHRMSQVTTNGHSQPYARQLSQSPASFAQNTYEGYAQPTYPYRPQQYDPALFNNASNGPPPTQPFTPYGNNVGIAPQALGHGVLTQSDPAFFGRSDLDIIEPIQQPLVATSSQSFVDQAKLQNSIPKGSADGYFTIIDDAQLSQTANSHAVANFLHVGNELLNWPMNRSTTIPSFSLRRSVNELKLLAGNDPNFLAKLNNKSNSRKRRTSKIAAANKTASAARLGDSTSDAAIYERDSSSEDESSVDDSSYTSDEDLENAPIPNKRPDSLMEGVEYDTIKALWRSKRRSVDSANIKKALADFWDIVKTIRDRWKADQSAVTEAEKKKASDLAVLKSRVKDQRDMIESAFKAALKHGHRSIIEYFSENLSLMFLCYQFLLDRLKNDDVNSVLPRTILEVLSLCTTLTQETLDRVHLDVVLPRIIKKGDAKTAFYAKKIVANAPVASRQASDASSDVTKPKTTEAGITTIAMNGATTAKRQTAEAAVGAKRAAPPSEDGTATKKVALGTTVKSNNGSPASKITVSSKAGTTGGDTSKPQPSTTLKSKPVVKQSSFFANLQSAAKKPGTSIKNGNATAASVKPGERKATNSNTAPKSTFSFAETMANLTKPKEVKKTVQAEPQLPPETAEEKAKRLRKEARRKLHVSFKRDAELVEIRYFDHDPEEDLGHEPSQMRDVSDVGGEGRMLKLHQDMMDLDEEEEEDFKFLEFFSPKAIDLSRAIDEDDKKRNYVQRGGTNEVESPERLEREKYEASTLSVFYADSSDVPPNPREPAGIESVSSDVSARTAFGLPEDSKYVDRARVRRLESASAKFNAGTHHHQQQEAPALATPTFNPQLSDILAKLSGQAQGPPAPQQQFADPYAGVNHPPPQAPPIVQPTIDIAAILAQLQQHGLPPAAQPAVMPSYQNNATYENLDRKRMREDDHKYEFPPAKKPMPAPGPSSYLYKTKTCSYWRENRCLKGENCTYAHEELPGG